MTTPRSRSRRRRTILIVMGACLLGLATAAIVVDNDAVDSILGFFAGALSVVVLAYFAVMVLRRPAEARRRDAAMLDDLEPLRGTKEPRNGDQP